jgi:antitoxin ParD1/3/4
MPSIEKISIALPQEMIAALRQAVEEGEYASSSEVVRDALRDWSHKRDLRRQNLDALRQAWREAIENPGPVFDAEEVLDRLKKKYRSIAKASPASESRRK